MTVPLASPPGLPFEHPAKMGPAAASFTNAFLSMVHALRGMVGFLVWFGVDLILYGNFTISTNIFPLVDGSLEIVRTGIVGAIIATVLGRSEEV